MVPIKLFVIFILGAAAIEPVVALPARGSKIRPPIPKDFQSAYNPVVAPSADTNHKPVQVVAPSAEKESKSKPIAPPADTNHKPVQVVAPSPGKESKPVAPPANEKPSKKAFIKGLFDRKPKPTIPLSPSPPSDYISKNFERVKGSLMDLGYTNVEEFPWHGKNNEE